MKGNLTLVTSNNWNLMKWTLMKCIIVNHVSSALTSHMSSTLLHWFWNYIYSRVLKLYVSPEGTVRYTGLLPAPEEGFSLLPRLLKPLGQKKKLLTLFVIILGNFWCSVITSVMFSSYLSNFEKNLKNPKKSKNVQKNKN